MRSPEMEKAAPARAGGDLQERLGGVLGNRFKPILRSYQETGVDQLRAALLSGASRLCYVLPTGGGKTVVFAFLIASASAKGRRILILAHRIEIIEQIAVALDSFGVTHGIIAPDAEETDDAVQVASVASLNRRLDRWRDSFDLVVIDEAHHAIAHSWAKIIASQPRAKFLGVTATPERLDGKGLGDVFEQMVEGPTIGELIDAGHLSPFTVFAPDASPDLSGVKTRLGDYELEGLRNAMGGVVIGAAVDEYLRLCPNTPAVCFCIDIAHSEQVAARFRAHGIRAAHLDGETPAPERRRIIAALGSSDLDVLCNCGIVSEGVDVPALGAAILLRPTQSLALHLQQCGRALRPAPGKDKALILDFAGNCMAHGLPDEPRDWSLESKARRERGKTPAMAKRCKECGALNRLAARVCIECGNDLTTPKERAEIAMRLREAESAALAREIRAMPYRARLRWADGDEERLRTVARACNYQRGWIYHCLAEHREKAA
jgi:superfamily II DNA or RNA helicase